MFIICFITQYNNVIFDAMVSGDFITIHKFFIQLKYLHLKVLKYYFNIVFTIHNVLIVMALK